MARILIADDDAAQRRIMASILNGEGHDVLEASSAEEALERLQQRACEVVLTDMRMPGQGGLHLVESAAKLSTAPEIVVVTAFGGVDTAVKAMRLGAYDYLNKPLDRNELVLLVQRAAEKFALRRDSQRWQQASRVGIGQGLVAESIAMKAILETIGIVSQSDSTVLIQGESGTGKERVAKLIHSGSARRSKPMMSINCSAFPETLLEAELYGYEKGAFTGAIARKIGLLETADGSTLFLDEVGDMPLSLQAKLLRAIQEREIRRVGGTASIPVDLRILAATNRNLSEAIRQGTFREDLFYRLNVIPIFIPPLRDRNEDIPPLVSQLLAHPSRRKSITPEALEILLRYDWPGNVRELEAVLVRVSVLTRNSEIRVEDLPSELRHAKPKSNVAQSIEYDFDLPPEGIIFEDVERDLMIQALKRSHGIMADASKLLGMTYRTFQYRAVKFGLKGQ